MKRIFSLNMICYLRCKGQKEIRIILDEDTHLLCYEFIDTKTIRQMIKEYKLTTTQVHLHQFVTEFKRLKQEIYLYQKWESDN